MLRWFKDNTKIHLLARDAGISQATAYRYPRDAVDVIADRAPELTDVLAHGLAHGWEHVCLDSRPDQHHPLHRALGGRAGRVVFR